MFTLKINFKNGTTEIRSTNASTKFEADTLAHKVALRDLRIRSIFISNDSSGFLTGGFTRASGKLTRLFGRA